MIPNGYYDCPSYKISSRYVNDFKDNTRVYCSNCNWCAAKASPARAACVCVDHNIVFPNPSISAL